MLDIYWEGIANLVFQNLPPTKKWAEIGNFGGVPNRSAL
jgi:hypothetical protein